MGELNMLHIMWLMHIVAMWLISSILARPIILVVTAMVIMVTTYMVDMGVILDMVVGFMMLGLVITRMVINKLRNS